MIAMEVKNAWKQMQALMRFEPMLGICIALPTEL